MDVVPVNKVKTCEDLDFMFFSGFTIKLHVLCVSVYVSGERSRGLNEKMRSLLHTQYVIMFFCVRG